MSVTRIVLASVVFGGALVLFGPSRPAIAEAVAAEAVAAEKYFGCPTGYTFQTSGSVARCYLAGSTSTQNIVCGLGYVKALDQFNGGRDACQNKANVVANYSCPNGYSPTVRPGPDVCTKDPSIIPPTVEKSI